MKKFVLALILGTTLVMGSAADAKTQETEVIASFANNIAGSIYIPISEDHRLILGGGAALPARGQTGIYFLAGIENAFDLFGPWDIEASVFRTNASGSDTAFNKGVNNTFYTVEFVQKWMVAVTDKFNVGIRSSILQFQYDQNARTTTTSLLRDTFPVVGIVINM